MVALEGEEEPVAAAPTMMSKEARQLFLSNDPDAGLRAWKVSPYFHPSITLKRSPWWTPIVMSVVRRATGSLGPKTVERRKLSQNLVHPVTT